MDSAIKKPKKAKPNVKLKEQRQLRGWSQDRVAQVIGTDPKRVGVWERGESLPAPEYQRKLIKLFERNAQELGFLEDVQQDEGENTHPTATNSSHIATLASQNTSSVSSTNRNTLDALLKENTEAPVIIVVSDGEVAARQILFTSVPVDIQRTRSTYSLADGKYDLLVSSRGEELGEAPVDRKQFLHHAARVSGSLLFMPDNMLIAELSELSERVIRAVQKPSTIDVSLFNYLEKRSQVYWQDRHSAAIASFYLLTDAKEHLQKMTKLLEETLLPTERTRLCAIVSKTFLLVGELLLDMSYYTQARNFHEKAIIAAQEACNPELEAIAWGRLSLAWTYSKKVQHALICVQKARNIAAGNTSPTVRAWLAAIEAEAQANLDNRDACLLALDAAEYIEEQQQSLEEMYLVHFDRSLLGGYQGACYRRLSCLEDPQSRFFLEKAQGGLLDALQSLNPSFIQRQPTFLADLADTYFQQGEIEETCRRAAQAVTTASQIKLQKVLQRLFVLRQKLEPWKDAQYVKNFDEHLAPLLASSREVE